MPNLDPYCYAWPSGQLDSTWAQFNGHIEKTMPESADALAEDSRWPAFFPAPICIATTTDGYVTAMERIVGASIVNRFPYVIAISLCRELLSARHHPRSRFMKILEDGQFATLQFLPPGAELDRVMQTVASIPEDHSEIRIDATELRIRPAVTNPAALVFGNAYMVYEARLVQAGLDFDGQPIYQQPYVDVGSHRIYFLEITAIQLRHDLAEGRSQIHWRALPDWRPKIPLPDPPTINDAIFAGRYRKPYTPHYNFPSLGTIAFEPDEIAHGMAIKYLPPLAADQVEIDNDRARWPCYFPSSLGLITTWTDAGTPNWMPCGSTAVVSRHPMVIATCISYAAINARYSPRASLELVRKRGRFGCGIPFAHPTVIEAIRYAGNISVAIDSDKAAHAGLKITAGKGAPVLTGCPTHYDCKVINEIRLGTHAMFLGQVQSILVRSDVTPENPIKWFPLADVDVEAIHTVDLVQQTAHGMGR